MSTTKPQTFTEITAEQVESWKNKHGKVFMIEVPISDDPNDDDKARFYAKAPSVAQMDAITEIASDKKRGGAVPAAASLKATVILGGDMKFLEADYPDASVYMAVMEQVGEIVSQKKAKLKVV